MAVKIDRPYGGGDLPPRLFQLKNVPMKLIEVRKKIHRCFLFFGSFWLIQALYGLYSGKAIVTTRPHFYAFKTELVPLLQDAGRYWLYVNSQLVMGSLLILISIVKFPFLDPIFSKLQAEQAEGKRPFAWVTIWIKENKAVQLLTKAIGLIVWLMIISGVIYLCVKFSK